MEHKKEQKHIASDRDSTARACGQQEQEFEAEWAGEAAAGAADAAGRVVGVCCVGGGGVSVE